MDIPINAKVSCDDGVCGETTIVIMDPTTEKITHVVVKDQHFPSLEHLVPVDMIKESTPKSIKLRCSEDELAKMDEFIQHKFIKIERPFDKYPSSRVLLWPYVNPLDSNYIDIQSKNVPPGELAIDRGAKVEAVDGRVGAVDEFLINPINGQVSHIILQEGHLWNKKDVTIPISQVDHISDDIVYLKMDKSSIESLPAIPVKSWF